MTSPEPVSLAESLVAHADAIGERHRATEAALDPDDYDDPDLDELRAKGLEEVRTRIWHQCIPSRFQWAGIDDFTGGVHDELARWAATTAGENLLLLGPVGVGKTHAAVAAARLRFDRGAEIRFLPVVELLDLLRPGGPDHALYDLADIEVLVLDDLASERPTDWTAERLYALVNRRWLEQRPTIATTNLGPTELEAAVGPRVYSRLVGNGAVGVTLSGPDRRRRAHRE